MDVGIVQDSSMSNTIDMREQLKIQPPNPIGRSEH
jgi:hypothetical protein